MRNPRDILTDDGDFSYKLNALFAEWEKNQKRRRTLAGLDAARSRGRVGGRPKGLSQEAENKALAAESLYKERKLSVKEIAKRIGISTSTLYEYLKSNLSFA